MQSLFSVYGSLNPEPFTSVNTLQLKQAPFGLVLHFLELEQHGTYTSYLKMQNWPVEKGLASLAMLSLRRC